MGRQSIFFFLFLFSKKKLLQLEVKCEHVTSLNFYVYARPSIHCLSVSRNFYVRKFISVNEVEAMYERSRVNVKVEPRSTFTLTRDRPYIASILFTRVKITRQRKSTFKASHFVMWIKFCNETHSEWESFLYHANSP